MCNEHPSPVPIPAEFYQGKGTLPVKAYHLMAAEDELFFLALAFDSKQFNPEKLQEEGAIKVVVKSTEDDKGKAWRLEYAGLTISPFPLGVRGTVAMPDYPRPIGPEPEAILHNVIIEKIG